MWYEKHSTLKKKKNKRDDYNSSGKESFVHSRTATILYNITRFMMKNIIAGNLFFFFYARESTFIMVHWFCLGMA